MARFTDRKKEVRLLQVLVNGVSHVTFTDTSSSRSQVNEKFAIDLVAEEPPKEIHARHVWCDGGQRQ